MEKAIEEYVCLNKSDTDVNLNKIDADLYFHKRYAGVYFDKDMLPCI